MINKYWNHICLAIIAGMLAIIVLCSLTVFDFDYPRSQKAVRFMALMLAGMIVCLVLFASSLMDQRINKATYYFMCMISFEFLCLTLELVYWHITAHHVSDHIQALIYYAEDLVLPGLIIMFAGYLRQILRMNDQAYSNMKYHIIAINVVNVGILVINALTGWGFEVVNGEYVQGPLGFTLFLPPLLLILICFFTSMKYSSGLKQKIILGEYSIMPILSVVAFLPNYSASITYLTILISMLLMYSEVYLDRGIRIVRNEAAMAEQKVNMMVTNIEPTILSEALDSIADIKDNPEETKVALKMFKTYLEKNVSSINQRRPIPISDELEHVEIYIKLEKMRFRDNVNVTFDIKDRDFNIPALTLQMLVENAIKHGITQREEGGTIDISIFDSGTAHVIIVKDDGVGFDVNAPRDSERSHVGLDIISTRLKEYLNGSFDITSEVGVGTVATVTIPKRK